MSETNASALKKAIQRQQREPVQDRGHAAAIIGTIARHNESLPATPRQLGYLFYLGYRGDTRNISKAAAGRLIAPIKAHQPEHAL